ncbi:MAG: chromate transporter [Bacteroidaceae bacterium]|nr:chromate transporter [Bacteroidaceae bacterium]
MIYAILFISFIGVGFFGFGGPEAILSMLAHLATEEHNWLTQSQFADLLIVSRFVPGEASLNAATLSGYAASLSEYGMASSMGASLAAMVGLALPSYVWAELTYHLRIPTTWHDGLTHALALLKQAIPGLIGGAAIILASADNIGTLQSPWHLGISLFIMLFVVIGNVVFRINAAALLFLSALAGIMLL